MATTSQCMHETRIYVSRVMLVLLHALSIVLVAFGIWLLLPAHPALSFGWIFGEVLGTVICVFGVTVVVQIFFHAPLVVVDEIGIRDGTLLIGAGPIRWDEIAGLCSYTVNRQRVLGVLLRDVEPVLARLPKWKAEIVRLNVSHGRAPINIPELPLSCSVQDLLLEIRQFHEVVIVDESEVATYLERSLHGGSGGSGAGDE